jgi:phage shock protein C
MNEDMNNNEHDTQTKRLYRSRKNKIIAGVCGGFAEYLNIDPVLVRIAWVALTFLGGSGLLIYIAAIIIIPENTSQVVDTEQPSKKSDSGLFWGSLLIIAGAALLLKQFGFFYYFNIWHWPWKTIWSLVLIIVGILMLYNFTSLGSKRESHQDDSIAGQHNGRKQIYRSTNKMLAGVCAGIAEYFDIDPTLVRLGYVLLSIASLGMGLVVYILLMIILPQAPVSSDSTSVERKL